MNDLHFIRYDAKIMSCDIRGMTKEGKIAHFQLFNNLIIQDGFLPNRVEALLDYTSCALSDWARVRGELEWKGWRESKNFFFHPGTIKTINDSKERYVIEYNRTCKINGKKPLALTEPHKETGVVSIIERDDCRDAGRDGTRDEPPDVNQLESESESSIKQVPAMAGNHKAFIDGWCSNYKAQFKVDYKVDGGRDGKAVKQLLSMGILVVDLLDIAKKAWKINSFNGRQSQTIHGFKQYFNPIHVEVKNGTTSQTTKPNPRNFGITIGPTNYATAKPRAQREYEEKQRLAKQMDEAKNNPPTT